MRRKRRNRSTWFPTLGTSVGIEPLTLSSYESVSVEVNPSYIHEVNFTTLIPDETQDPADTSGSTGSTLRDFVEGQTCIIDRVVGKIHVAYNSNGVAPTGGRAQSALVCAALAVFPVSNDTNQPELDLTEMDPLNAANMDKPWMWRRTWAVSDLFQPFDNFSYFCFPLSNGFTGSMKDGPHVDTKGVKRAIQRNQRLFLVTSVVCLTPGEPQESGFVQIVSDLRVLGRMVKAKNRSLFT